MRRWTWMILLAAAALGCQPDNEAGNAGPVIIEPPGGNETQPADPPPPVDEILNRLERAGQAYPQIAADIRYRVDQPMTGDTELRTGNVKFQRAAEANPSRFYVDFDTLKLGEGPTLMDRVEYAFDGRWVTIAKHRIQQMTRFEVAAEGQAVDAFKLGEGPFPVPFGQDAETMRRTFEISLNPPREGDPANADCLVLIPRPSYQEGMGFTRIDLWVDRTTDLPVKIRTVDKNRNVTTVDFENTDTGQSFNETDFRLLRKIGWEYAEHRLEDQ